MSSQRPALAIVGPTGVGKTAVATDVCRVLEAEIISIDSRQVYRGIEIVSNAPTRRELAGVACHLVACLDPRVKVNAARYQAMAWAALADVQGRERLAVLTAGTGLYLKAVLEGLHLGGIPAAPAARARLEAAAKKDLAGLVRRLRRLDPEAAVRVDIRNPVRVVRAVELAQARRRSTAAPTRDPVPAVKVGLDAPRAELYAWIEARVDRMLRRRWQAEIERLLQAGIDPRGQAFSGIGVVEMADVVRGTTGTDEARAAIIRKTRNYAKRQMTWFRADPDVRWLDVTAFSRSDIVDQLVSMVPNR